MNVKKRDRLGKILLILIAIALIQFVIVIAFNDTKILEKNISLNEITEILCAQYQTSGHRFAQIMQALNKPKEDAVEILKNIYNCSDEEVEYILQMILY